MAFLYDYTAKTSHVIVGQLQGMPLPSPIESQKMTCYQKSLSQQKSIEDDISGQTKKF
jgi:hypothetical protein